MLQFRREFFSLAVHDPPPPLAKTSFCSNAIMAGLKLLQCKKEVITANYETKTIKKQILHQSICSLKLSIFAGKGEGEEGQL